VLLALDDVDELIVSLMTELVEERRALAGTQVPTSTSQSTRLPLTQGQGPIYRADNDKSAATNTRNSAKTLDKRVVTEGRHTQEVHAVACLESAPSRHRCSVGSYLNFYDRHGSRRQHDPGDVLGLALRRWCLARGCGIV
jgi:hypothetical protein